LNYIGIYFHVYTTKKQTSIWRRKRKSYISKDNNNKKKEIRQNEIPFIKINKDDNKIGEVPKCKKYRNHKSNDNKYEFFERI